MTYYDVLNVPRDATEEEIKTAYRNMLKAFHPDYYAGDKAFAENMTRRIVEAYSVLKDPEKRKNYDYKVFPKSNSPEEPSHCNHSEAETTTQSDTGNAPKSTRKTHSVKSTIVCSLAFLVVVFFASLLYFDITTESPSWDEIYSAVQSQEAKAQEEKQPRQIVYITENGTKYHREQCSTIAKSKKYTVFLTPELIQEYGPCSVCDPPLLSLGD